MNGTETTMKTSILLRRPRVLAARSSSSVVISGDVLRFEHNPPLQYFKRRFESPIAKFAMANLFQVRSIEGVG